MRARATAGPHERVHAAVAWRPRAPHARAVRASAPARAHRLLKEPGVRSVRWRRPVRGGPQGASHAADRNPAAERVRAHGQAHRAARVVLLWPALRTDDALVGAQPADRGQPGLHHGDDAGQRAAAGAPGAHAAWRTVPQRYDDLATGVVRRGALPANLPARDASAAQAPNRPGRLGHESGRLDSLRRRNRAGALR